MAVIVSKQKEIDAYFASSDVNQSKLKDLEYGFDNYMGKQAKRNKELEEGSPEKEHFLIGNMVDCILTGEEGQFEKKYYISEMEKKPSETEMKIVDIVFDELQRNEVEKDTELSDCYDMIAMAIEEVGWQPTWKEPTKVAKIIDKCQVYFDELQLATGKTIVSKTQSNKCDAIVMSLKTNPRTARYFDREMQENTDNVDFYYQLPIYFKIDNQHCKALMDMVVVTKDPQGNITSVIPVDLKTMSGYTLNFIDKIRSLRYDIQAAWYVEALAKKFKVKREIIRDFKFIVESSTNPGSPLLFEINNETLTHGEFGTPDATFVCVNTGKEMTFRGKKGFRDLLFDYNYYEEQGWKNDVVLDDNKVTIKLDFYKGIVDE